ncbi:MAG: hypothetical protein IKU84_05605 [Clostridia bacterium]|nr:hypothetical protein [Clostridia bacterium]
MATAKKKKDELLSYKGRPVSRKDNTIYYGSMADSHIVMLQINETKTEKDGLEVATRVSVQLQLTDFTVRTKDRIIKKTEVNGLYDAFDIGAVWLERALSAK